MVDTSLDWLYRDGEGKYYERKCVCRVTVSQYSCNSYLVFFSLPPSPSSPQCTWTCPVSNHHFLDQSQLGKTWRPQALAGGPNTQIFITNYWNVLGLGLQEFSQDFIEESTSLYLSAFAAVLPPSDPIRPDTFRQNISRSVFYDVFVSPCLWSVQVWLQQQVYR